MLTDIQKGSVVIPGPLYPDLFLRRETPIMIPAEAVCLGCGCSDFDACEGGCWWHTVNYDAGIGECSNCAGAYTMIIERWDEIASLRRNESDCRRCGSKKDWIIVRRHGRIVVAIRCCMVCYG